MNKNDNNNFFVIDSKIKVLSLYDKNGNFLCSVHQTNDWGREDQIRVFPGGCLVSLKDIRSRLRQFIFYNNEGSVVMNISNIVNKRVMFDNIKISVEKDGIHTEEYFNRNLVRSQYFAYENTVTSETEKFYNV